MDSKDEQRSGKVFNFDGLPVELKHKVFQMFKTQYLEDVCANVSQDWMEIVTDVLQQRRINVDQLIPAFIRNEISMRNTQQVVEEPLGMLKFYESCRLLTRKFDVTPVEMNANVFNSKVGLLWKLWMTRDCDCAEWSECMLRRVHLLPAFNIFVVDFPSLDEGLQFYNLSELDCLDPDCDPRDPYETIDEYDCPEITEWMGDSHTTNTGISVFRDQIAVEIYAKTILLLKIKSVDHVHRLVKLERDRVIHLSLWASALCLFEDRLVVLHTTGHVGMWDKTMNELFISTTTCNLGDIEVSWMHRIKMYRIGKLVLVKANASGSGVHRWYAIDPYNSNLIIHPIEMTELMDAGLHLKRFRRSVVDVFHIDIWYNCLLVHCEVEGGRTRSSTSQFLAFKIIARYPTIQDFLDPKKFLNDFLSKANVKRLQTLNIDSGVKIAFTSPFSPNSPLPGQSEYPDNEPVPMADIISAQLQPRHTSMLGRCVLKAFRIRLAILPDVVKESNTVDESSKHL